MTAGSPWRRRWPLAALLVLALVFTLMLVFSRKAPVITGISPDMAAPGESVTITGDYFGRTAREGQLMLAGLTPPPSVIQVWSDQKIVFQVPVDAPSGLVTVSNSQGVSSSVLFTNTLTIPTVLKTRVVSTPVEITSVEPASPVAGELVTLAGRSLGRAEAGSWLLLSADASGATELKLLPEETASWNDLAIVFRLPDGWGPESTVTVHTSRGQSSPFALQAQGPSLLERPRRYELDWAATTRVLSGSGALRLLPPLPQAGVTLARELAPGATLRWTSPTAAVSTSLRFHVTSFAHRWVGWASGTPLPDAPPPAAEVRPPDERWKTQTAALKALAAKWGLDAADPLARAKRLVAGLNATFHRGSAALGAPATAEALLASRGLNPLEAASLSVALAKVSSLPARQVFGFLADGQTLRPHTWVQLWIPGAAWLDVDPWLALDADPTGLDASFGSLGNDHLPWSFGTAVPQRREPASQPVAGVLPYGTNGLLAEVTGSLQVEAPVWATPTLGLAKAP